VEFKAGKIQAAIKCFKAASNLNPSNSIILCCIGSVRYSFHDSNRECLERAGDFLGATDQYRIAVEITPSNISARYQLARMYIHLKYFDVCPYRTRLICRLQNKSCYASETRLQITRSHILCSAEYTKPREIGQEPCRTLQLRSASTQRLGRISRQLS